MIEAHLKEAKNKIEAEKIGKVATVREQVMREKVLPYNAEIDKARESAVAELLAEHNKKVVSLTSSFEEEKRKLVEAGEKKKTEYAERVISTETAVVSLAYDNAIAKLQQQIDELEKK